MNLYICDGVPIGSKQKLAKLQHLSAPEALRKSPRQYPGWLEKLAQPKKHAIMQARSGTRERHLKALPLPPTCERNTFICWPLRKFLPACYTAHLLALCNPH